MAFCPHVSSQQPRVTDIPTHTNSIVRTHLKESSRETVDHEGLKSQKANPATWGTWGTWGDYFKDFHFIEFEYFLGSISQLRALTDSTEVKCLMREMLATQAQGPEFGSLELAMTTGVPDLSTKMRWEAGKQKGTKPADQVAWRMCL